MTAADISAEAIAMAKRNAERNGLDNMDFLCEDTFELLPRLEKEGTPTTSSFSILRPLPRRAAPWRMPCAATRRSTSAP